MARWIKIYDKFVEWEWYNDVYAKVVFLHLLLMCNASDKRWKGKVIKRGQYLTSTQHLADALGVSNKTVERTIKKLKSTGEISVKTSRGKYGGTLITVCNYDKYQANYDSNTQLSTELGTELKSQLGTELETDNIRIIDNKSNKNILLERDNTREENFSNIAPPDEVYEWTDIGIVMKRDAGWIESSLMVLRRKCPSITEEQLYVAIDTFCELQQTSGTFRYTKNKFKQHFTNWVNTQIKTFTNGNNRKEFGTSYIDRIEESKRELREGVVKSVLSGLDIERAGSYDEYAKSL